MQLVLRGKEERKKGREEGREERWVERGKERWREGGERKEEGSHIPMSPESRLSSEAFTFFLFSFFLLLPSSVSCFVIFIFFH